VSLIGELQKTFSDIKSELAKNILTLHIQKNRDQVLAKVSLVSYTIYIIKKIYYIYVCIWVHVYVYICVGLGNKLTHSPKLTFVK